MRKTLVLFALLTRLVLADAQTAYQHVSDLGIYNLLDELATMQIIDVTTAVKPYSRVQIARWLDEAEGQWTHLSLSQRSRLENFRKEYMMERGELKTGGWSIYSRDTTLSVHLLTPEIAYKDSMFRFLVRPVYGYRNFSGGNDNFWATYGGAEVISYIGNNWTVYASLRDNFQKGQRLAQPGYFTHEQGGTYKVLTGGGMGGEFSEMRGGITWNWSWGALGLIKDHIQWGDNLNGSNIFSGRTPSFPMIKLHMHPAKWLEFNYYHGWLVSESLDSLRSVFPDEGRARRVNRPKYIAANMFTLKPFSRLHLSMGNSVVYGDMDVQPGFLIPFFFYKSIVHTINWGASLQNNAMYVNLSSRQIRNLHLYATYFIDEFSIRRVGDPERHNFTGFKGGFTFTGVKNAVLGFEYTRTNPITYLHDEPTTSFETNRYNLGHYLTDNAEEYFATLRIYPAGTLELGASWVYARKGNYYEYIRGMRNPRIDELPVLQDIIWDKTSLTFDATLRPLPNLRVFARYALSDINGYDADGRTGQQYLDMFTPPYLHGKVNVLELGFGMGF
jgi:hypothetical protein